MKDRPFQLTDIVRETSYAIHRYHGCGHLEEVYENALVHRLRKLGFKVEQQRPLTVCDEDGTVIGEYFADLLVEDQLIIEVKAAKAIADEHIAQVLGYLRSARMEQLTWLTLGPPNSKSASSRCPKLCTSRRRNSPKKGNGVLPKETKKDERR